MLSDYTISVIVSLIGVVVLACAFLALAVRSRGDQAVIWKGFGVTFEIKPCRLCPRKMN